MWVLWFGPLVAFSFLGGLTLAAVLLRLRRIRTVPQALGAAALPFVCAALPVIGLTVVSVVASAFAPSKDQLYEEIFARPAHLPAERLRFASFGKGEAREILLRMEPDSSEIESLRRLPGLVAAAMSEQAFVDFGTRHGLHGWWMREGGSDPVGLVPGTPCSNPVFLAADGFNGWRNLRIAACSEDRGQAPSVFVYAAGR